MSQELPPSVEQTALATLEESRLSRERLIRLARTDINYFVPFVMRDEKTGGPVTQAPIHAFWHSLAAKHKRLIIWSAIESGKTFQFSLADTLMALGKNPNERCIIVSANDDQSKKIARLFSDYIERSEELHEVFPDLLPGKPWGMHSLTVVRDRFAKEPSLASFGINGNPVGSRCTRLNLDDILSYENTRTLEQRDKVEQMFDAKLEGRLDVDARVLCVGTAWDKDDFMHRKARHPSWAWYRFPVLRRDGTPSWAERWPLWRIEEKRGSMTLLEFERQLLCRARSDDESMIKEEWINLALTKGNGINFPTYALKVIPKNFSIYTGVDFGHRQKTASDPTVFVTIAVHPNGDREVINIQSGKWTFPEIVRKLLEIYSKFNSIFVVENVAAQDWVQQYTNEVSAVPIIPFTTGGGKHSLAYQFQHMATELSNGKWIFPNKSGNCHPEMDKFIAGLMYYDPRGHCDDWLASALMARYGAMLGSAIQIETGSLDLMSR